jgi:hypothetical protein
MVFIIGVGVGFVLGARAGRERYEQLQKLARKAAASPAVRQARTTMQAQAADLAKMARGKLAVRAETARAKMGGALHDRMPGMRHRDANGHVTVGRRRGAQAQGVPGETEQ